MLLWTLVGCLTIAALLPVLWPLLMRRASVPSAAGADADPLVAVYRDRQREIERERAAGRLSADEARTALDELVAQMARELPEESAPTAPTPQSTGSAAARGAAIAIALLVPAASLMVYLALGAPELATDEIAVADGEIDERKLDQMITDLERRVRGNPDDGEAWMMLAGARKFRGQPAEANQAFEEALRRVPPSARLLAEFAESLAITRDGRFDGRPFALLEQALRLDPDDPKAIALMGAAQFQAGNLAAARGHLKRLLDSMPPDQQQRDALRDVLARIDARIAAGDGATSPADATPASRAATTGAEAVSGRVELDPSLAERAKAARTLFVVARSPAGPRVPFAVLRIDNPSLPLDFRLDDSLAMDPSRRLSGADQVVIEVRLSASGNAIRQPGDLFGESKIVRPGEQGLSLRINQVIQP
jgi:cytochrome c-type biogenesis protein CcmH